ncbi:MAG TPA: arginase family protein [Myxococcota bacterium]|jgi:agmatinase|nr:arginase family protein [Myxococcota bacterium]
MNALDELGLLLRPAGGGLYLVSSGRAAQLRLQRRLYGLGDADGEEAVAAAHRAALARLAEARVVLLGVPSDVGAGYLRGANLGPQAIREALCEAVPDWPARAAAAGVVDAGDVFVVPQLLHDDMVSDAQKTATRAALYRGVAPADAAALPVSPLSIAERALDLVFLRAPHAAPVVLGGDHSCAWPVVAALARSRARAGAPPWGIVQPDAHTDLLAERLGVKYCFGSWSYHANDLLGRGGRLVQVGLRASRHDRAHWEETLGVRQFWADECRTRPAAVLDDIVTHLRAAGVSAVYLSNDIDGTDEAWADATGTPEPGGLEPDFVVELIRRLGRAPGLCGGDVMEVAPPLERTPGGAARTVALAARYVRETIAAILGRAV